VPWCSLSRALNLRHLEQIRMRRAGGKVGGSRLSVGGSRFSFNNRQTGRDGDRDREIDRHRQRETKKERGEGVPAGVCMLLPRLRDCRQRTSRYRTSTVRIRCLHRCSTSTTHLVCTDRLAWRLSRGLHRFEQCRPCTCGVGNRALRKRL
jgi:hypothetical protein